jgi:hypothetical protein
LIGEQHRVEHGPKDAAADRDEAGDLVELEDERGDRDTD